MCFIGTGSVVVDSNVVIMSASCFLVIVDGISCRGLFRTLFRPFGMEQDACIIVGD